MPMQKVQCETVDERVEKADLGRRALSHRPQRPPADVLCGSLDLVTDREQGRVGRRGMPESDGHAHLRDSGRIEGQKLEDGCPAPSAPAFGCAERIDTRSETVEDALDGPFAEDRLTRERITERRRSDARFGGHRANRQVRQAVPRDDPPRRLGSYAPEPDQVCASLWMRR